MLGRGDPVASAYRDLDWVARTKLNIAWNYLIADCPTEAETQCLSAVEEIEKQKDLHGRCEAFRILAQAAVMREDITVAETYLGRVSNDVPLLSPRDQAETALARLNWTCGWSGDRRRSGSSITWPTIRSSRMSTRCGVTWAACAGFGILCRGL